jgi:TPR repeat protein
MTLHSGKQDPHRHWALRCYLRTLSACVLIVSLSAICQTTKIQDGSAPARKPFTKPDILQLLELKTPDALLIRRIKAVGVDFEASDGDIDELTKAGASNALLAVIRDAGHRLTDWMTAAEIAQQAESLFKQKRFSEAFPYLQKACERGNSESCLDLGFLFDTGQGVAKDNARAFALYSKSCDGDPTSCGNLGVMYHDGRGVEADDSRAITLFSKACDAGNALSCENLGVMYEYGHGIAANVELATQSLKKSCSLGDQNACARLHSPKGSQGSPKTQSQIIYEAGLRDYLAGSYDDAAREFRQVLQSDSQDDSSQANAQFYLGEIAYRQTRYPEAIDAFDVLLRKYDSSFKAPAAEMHKGLALLQLDKRDEAIEEFRLLTQRYPQTPEAVQARIKLNSLGAGNAAASQQPTGLAGRIHGRVTNPTGVPQAGGTVSLSTDSGRSSMFTFPVSASGEYAGEAAPGIYTIVFRQADTSPDKTVDSFQGIQIAAGQDVQQDVDMSRSEFVDKLPPQQRKTLDEIRQHNAAAMKVNDVIRGLNADLRVVTQDIKDADGARLTAVQALGSMASKTDLDVKEAEIKTAKYTEIEALMLKDTGAKPDASILWAQLGQAQVGLKKYDEAESTYKKALEIEAASRKPNLQIQGLATSGLGEIYARTGKVREANAAYDAAAKVNPTQAAFYLRNETVIFFQMNNAEAQVDAANEAILADPNQPLLYYLKGQGLILKATLAPKTQKIVVPPGCVEAYRKYLELAPTGPYASQVKQILERIR